MWYLGESGQCIISRQQYQIWVRKHDFVKLTLCFNFRACLDSLYGGTASFFSKSAPITLFFITWGQQNKSSNTANHRALLTPHKSETKGQSRKREKNISGVIGFTCLHITMSFIIHSATRLQKGGGKKSITYLPHLGSSFPLVSAVNWRQVLICCHQNWCINPRAPSLWCRGQYGWTSLSWNKLAMRKVLWKGSHVSYFTSAQS